MMRPFFPFAVLAAALAGAIPSPAQDTAAQFMGGHVDFPYHSAFISGRNYTIEGWVRNTSNPGGDFDLFSRIDPGNTETKYLRIYADGSFAGMYQDLLAGELRTAPGVVPTDQAWHHLAFVVDDAAGQASLYLDGNRLNTTPLLPNNVGNAVGLGSVVGSDGAVGWQLSELRVSDVARYDQPSHAIDENWIGDGDTVLLLSFDEPAGSSTISDASANAMTGTVVGQLLTGMGGMHGDADADGLGDDDELGLYSTLPFDKDTDDDGLSDYDEVNASYAFGALDPLSPDTDTDGIQDGTEAGATTPIAGDPGQDVEGTDPLFFVPDADDSTTTDPTDFDTDDDGFPDGQEDVDFDGLTDPDELDPGNLDTDGDGVQDGTESSLTSGTPHTDPGIFIPDADPLTSTDPLDSDSDVWLFIDGPLTDGKEDLNANGAYEPLLGELDPNDPVDDHFRLDIPALRSGQPFEIDVREARPFSVIWVLYTRHGWGPTYVPEIDLQVQLDGLMGRYDFPIAANADGAAVYFGVLPNIAGGFWLQYQAVENFDHGRSYRLSNADQVYVHP